MPDRAVVTYHESNYWKDNQRWVVRDGPAPLHDPPGGCCEMCGCDECTLTWVPPSDLPPRFAGSPGEWLCERCEPRSQPMPDRAVMDDDCYWVCDACEAMWDISGGIPGWVGHCPDCGAMMRRVAKDGRPIDG